MRIKITEGKGMKTTLRIECEIVDKPSKNIAKSDDLVYYLGRAILIYINGDYL